MNERRMTGKMNLKVGDRYRGEIVTQAMLDREKCHHCGGPGPYWTCDCIFDRVREHGENAYAETGRIFDESVESLVESLKRLGKFVRLQSKKIEELQEEIYRTKTK